MNRPRIAVVGSFVQDLTFNCQEFPRPGETIIGQFITGPGGKGSNQAVAAARAGARVTYLGAVGADAFGEGARAFHAAEGIECLAAEKRDWPTGAAGILVNFHGQNEIVVSLGANGALEPADIDRHAGVIGEAKVLVSQLEANLDATHHALRLARKAGAIVVLNPAPMRDDFDPTMLAEVDILIPNETEFVTLVTRLPEAGRTAGAGFDGEALEKLDGAGLQAVCRTFGVATMIVTLGARGCFISRADGFEFAPAMQGIRAIDTTGAGDAFVGAFATGLAEWGLNDLARVARFANAAAGISVTRPGTAPVMPMRAEIDALLERA